jgi:hypothetical protein
MHIVILEADIPLPGVQQLYGPGYGHVFKKLFNSSAQGTDLEYSVYNVCDGKYPSDASIDQGVDAIVITGSKYCSYDDAPWIVALCGFIQRVYGRVKLIGKGLLAGCAAQFSNRDLLWASGYSTSIGWAYKWEYSWKGS